MLIRTLVLCFVPALGFGEFLSDKIFELSKRCDKIEKKIDDIINKNGSITYSERNDFARDLMSIEVELISFRLFYFNVVFEQVKISQIRTRIAIISKKLIKIRKQKNRKDTLSMWFSFIFSIPLVSVWWKK
jgi:hypothetical protein